MKSSPKPQSATSLPRSPQDEAHARSTKYLITMAIRVACFVLMVVVTPYGWYTWVFGAAAILLPYIAVVGANVSDSVGQRAAENPELALPAAPAAATTAPDVESTRVIRIEESPAITDREGDRG